MCQKFASDYIPSFLYHETEISQINLFFENYFFDKGNFENYLSVQNLANGLV
jgi:hypothetical protein